MPDFKGQATAQSPERERQEPSTELAQRPGHRMGLRPPRSCSVRRSGGAPVAQEQGTWPADELGQDALPLAVKLQNMVTLGADLQGLGFSVRPDPFGDQGSADQRGDQGVEFRIALVGIAEDLPEDESFHFSAVGCSATAFEGLEHGRKDGGAGVDRLLHRCGVGGGAG